MYLNTYLRYLNRHANANLPLRYLSCFGGRVEYLMLLLPSCGHASGVIVVEEESDSDRTSDHTLIVDAGRTDLNLSHLCEVGDLAHAFIISGVRACDSP